MTILSLDQASQTSGYAVFVDEKLVKYGTFTATSTDIGKRLTTIRSTILDLINTYNPDYVIFEEIQEQGGNVKTFKVLAEVYGIISQLLTEQNIPHEAMFSTTWKSALNIKGRGRTEQKRNAANHVQEKYGVTPTQDAADAICIGEAYILSKQCAWSN